jgi:hypothetical protein
VISILKILAKIVPPVVAIITAIFQMLNNSDDSNNANKTEDS